MTPATTTMRAAFEAIEVRPGTPREGILQIVNVLNRQDRRIAAAKRRRAKAKREQSARQQ